MNNLSGLMQNKTLLNPGGYWAIIALNIVAWLWAIALFHGQTGLIGTALLAWMFGLRHAVDVDHIAAIDNATRKLLYDGRNASSAGFFFSLGHASVVIIMCVAVAVGTHVLQRHMGDMQKVGGLISTLASALFLLLLAIANLLIFASVYKTFRAARRGETLVEQDLELLLHRRGFFARIFRPLFNLISHAWQLFPIGFLFGIGFDTATEIALFGLSSSQAMGGISLPVIMVMPALFTAGMLLIDTLDGIMMVRVYRWALVRPIRKIYYNMTITLLSVVVALLIGGIEIFTLLSDKLSWHFHNKIILLLTENFNALGCIVIVLFILSWISSILIYRVKKYDQIDVKILTRE